jgi:hypothetical protein
MPNCASADTCVIELHHMRRFRLHCGRFGPTLFSGFLPNPPRLIGRLMDGRFSYAAGFVGRGLL